MKKLLSLFITAALIFTMSINIFAASDRSVIYYVDASAQSGGDGSEKKPFCNITEARDAVRKYKNGAALTNNISVIFASGTYDISNTITFTANDSGNDGYSITYAAADGADVIFTGARTSDNGTVSVLSKTLIDIRGGEYIRFKNITFSDNLNAPLIRINSNNITLDSCTLSDSGFTKSTVDTTEYFALAGNGNNITVQNCEIFNTCGGVSLSGGVRATLTSGNNVITGNYLHHLSRIGISVSGVGASVDHNEITDCKSYAITFTGNSHKVNYNCIRRSEDSAITSDGGVTCYGNQIKYNYIDSAKKNGISLSSGLSGATVFGNIVRNTVIGIYLGGGRELAVENNIVICDSNAGNQSPSAISYDSSYKNSATADNTKYKTSISEFSAVPYNTGIWAKTFPTLAKISVPASLDKIKDMNDTSLFFNPAGTSMQNNAFYVSGNVKTLSLTISGAQSDGVAYQIRHGHIFNNILLPRESMTDFPAAELGNFALKSGAKIFKALPAFKNIAFNQIGIAGKTSKITFKDVTPSAWYYKWVVYAVNEGLMSGTDTWGGSFSPTVTTSRAMIIQMLYNLEGRPEVEYKGYFSDVKDGKWYTKAVTWAYENGITGGVSETEFAPDRTVTREQVAVFLYRYMRDYKKAELTLGADLSKYPDVDRISRYTDFKEALAWAVAEGIVTGKDDGDTVYLAPKDSAQRCEAAAMFARFNMEFGE